jgi:endonuclease III related protein
MNQAAAQPRRSEPGLELLEYYQELVKKLGPQNWWPARTRFEVILGAILTQNTSWNNVRLAIRRLRKADLMNHQSLSRAPLSEIESAIRPAGFFRQKAQTIRNFVSWLERSYGGSLDRMFRQPAERLRRELLSIKGLGPETADAILLYAGRMPYFVADAYTRRILGRHEFFAPEAGYSEVQEHLHHYLPRDARLFNEYHALLVEVGKRYCKRSEAQCSGCPLEPWLPGRMEYMGMADETTTQQAEAV